jgi:hypothetical protein
MAIGKLAALAVRGPHAKVITATVYKPAGIINGF